MISPQEWVEYNRQYEKYGIDMRPAQERVPVKERRRQQRERKSAQGKVIRLVGDYKVMLSIVLAFTLALIMVVMVEAYSADINYRIGETKAENHAISGEIEDLDVKLLSAGTITYIESQAKGKMGMKNPDAAHCVYLSEEDTPGEGFADILKEKAYN